MWLPMKFGESSREPHPCEMMVGKRGDRIDDVFEVSAVGSARAGAGSRRVEEVRPSSGGGSRAPAFGERGNRMPDVFE